MTRLLIIVLLTFFVQLARAQDATKIVEGNTAFALALYQELSKSNVDENLFFSPYSISEALAITYGGAQKNTADQIQTAMHFPVTQSELHKEFSALKAALNKKLDSIVLKTANSLWAQKGYTFKPNFLKIANDYYNAPTNYLNFKKNGSRNKALSKINEWVASKTDNQIPEILSKSDVTKETRLVLINAIWFYGEWLSSFDRMKTAKGTFYLSSGEQVTEFMRKEGKYFYYDDDIIQAIQIPYKGGKQSMTIFLPAKGRGISKLEKNFDRDYLSNIFKDMQMSTVAIRIPKFKSEYSVDLKETLEQMGIVEAFSDKADFSGMTTKNDLKISKIIHKAKIEVSEKGTKAAAATAVVMVRKTASIDQLVFNADHPFLYMIRDNDTGTILFLGKMASVMSCLK
ncbi:MAG: serpin family protein [Salinivirgaceae bacterium]|jgi:serpin B|nr:serpin family protein [Salinivirgaceae bacterium]